MNNGYIFCDREDRVFCRKLYFLNEGKNVNCVLLVLIKYTYIGPTKNNRNSKVIYFG